MPNVAVDSKRRGSYGKRYHDWGRAKAKATPARTPLQEQRMLRNVAITLAHRGGMTYRELGIAFGLGVAHVFHIIRMTEPKITSGWPQGVPKLKRNANV